MTDFVAAASAADVLQFSTALFANFAAVQSAMTQVGANTVIVYDASNTVTLNSVATSNLNADDFRFV